MMPRIHAALCFAVSASTLSDTLLAVTKLKERVSSSSGLTMEEEEEDVR